MIFVFSDTMEKKNTKLTPYLSLPKKDQSIQQFKWLTGKAPKRGKKLAFADVDWRNISDALSSDQVDTSLLSDYCDEEVIEALNESIEKKEDTDFKCGICYKSMKQCIKCDGCQLWYHFKCIRVSDKKPKEKLE